MNEDVQDEMDDIGGIDNVIWRLGQPNETVRGSLRVALANAREFLIAYRAVLEECGEPIMHMDMDGTTLSHAAWLSADDRTKEWYSTPLVVLKVRA